MRKKKTSSCISEIFLEQTRNNISFYIRMWKAGQWNCNIKHLTNILQVGTKSLLSRVFFSIVKITFEGRLYYYFWNEVTIFLAQKLPKNIQNCFHIESIWSQGVTCFNNTNYWVIWGILWLTEISDQSYKGKISGHVISLYHKMPHTTQ